MDYNTKTIVVSVYGARMATPVDQREPVVQQCRPNKDDLFGTVFGDCTMFGGASGSPAFARVGDQLTIKVIMRGEASDDEDYTPFSINLHSYSLGVAIDGAIVCEAKEFADGSAIFEFEHQERSWISGLCIADLNDNLRRRYKINGQVNGVVVTDVKGAPSNLSDRVAVGNVITRVDEDPITDVEALDNLIMHRRNAGAENVMLLVVDSQGNPNFVRVTLTRIIHPATSK
jgi:hypothetical protein